MSRCLEILGVNCRIFKYRRVFVAQALRVSLYFPTAINPAERLCYLFKAFAQKSDEIISLY